jgi:hypothetical protein
MSISSADAAAEPLISQQLECHRGENEVNGHVEVDESTLSSPSFFIWALTLCAGVSGLLFGYEYVYPFPAHLVAFVTTPVLSLRLFLPLHMISSYMHRSFFMYISFLFSLLPFIILPHRWLFPADDLPVISMY